MFEPGTFLTIILACVGTVIWFFNPYQDMALRVKSQVIWLAIALHTIWGIALLGSDAPLSITAISTIVRLGLVSAHGAGTLFLTVAACASLGIFMSSSVGIFFFLPQIAMLILSAYGAIHAIVCGCFADGVVRTHMFLAADQAPYILLAIFYIVARINQHIKDHQEL